MDDALSMQIMNNSSAKPGTVYLPNFLYDP